MSWANRRDQSRSTWCEPRQQLSGFATTPRQARGRDRYAARQDDRGHRRAPDVDAARGTRGWPSMPARLHRVAPLLQPCDPMGISVRRRRSRKGVKTARASGRRTRRRCRSDSARARWVDCRPRAARRPRRRGSSGRGRASYSRRRGTAPCSGSRRQLPVPPPSEPRIRPGSPSPHYKWPTRPCFGPWRVCYDRCMKTYVALTSAALLTMTQRARSGPGTEHKGLFVVLRSAHAVGRSGSAGHVHEQRRKRHADVAPA